MFSNRRRSVLIRITLALFLAACSVNTNPQPTPQVEATAVFSPTSSPVATETNQLSPPDQVSITPVRVAIKTALPIASATPTQIPACPGSLPWQLKPGQTGMVSQDPPVSNRVRTAPEETSEVIGQIAPGEMLIVLEGPECAGGFTWWLVRSLAQTLEGWTAESSDKTYWLLPYSTSTQTATVTRPPALTLLPGKPYAFATATLAPSRPLLGSGYQLLVDRADRIFIYDVDRGVETPLGKRNGTNIPPEWGFSPDGQRIIYKANLPNKNEERLFITNLTTGDTLMLPYEPPFYNILWHPSGTAVKINNELVDPNTGLVISRIYPVDLTQSYSASFSPDGRFLAVTAYYSKSFSVIEILFDSQGRVTGAQNHMTAYTMFDHSLVQEIVFDKNGQITSTTERVANYPVVQAQGSILNLAWAPRGDRIALRVDSADGGAIYLVNPEGTGLMNITSSFAMQKNQLLQYYMAWSPDGSKIAFETWEQTSSNTYNNSRTFVIDLGNGQIKDITGKAQDVAQNPFWSPDSQWVLYANASNRFSASRPDGSETIPLMENVFAVIGGFRPGPSGQPVNVNEGYQKASTPTATPSPTRTPKATNTPAAPPTRAAELIFGLPSPTPDQALANTLMYALWPERNGGGADYLYKKPAFTVIDSTGKVISQFTPPLNSTLTTVAWSPDRQRIAYVMETGDRLFVANNDGSGEKELLATGPRAIKWSPDSTLLAYLNDYDLRVISTLTGQEVLVGSWPNTEGISFDWSPDGLSIAVVADKLYIYRLMKDTRLELTLTAGHALPGVTAKGIDYVDWSPDGRRLVFTKDKGLWIVNNDGRELATLSTCEAGYAWPQWSPDGSTIAYLTDCGKDYLMLYVLPSAGQGPARLVSSGMNPLYGIDWSPDGQWIAWVSDAFPSLTKPIYKSRVSRQYDDQPLTGANIPASHPFWTP